MLATLLSNVPLGTADALSWSMLVVVAVFLVSGTSIAYYFWRESKKGKAAAPTGSA
ncbi:MAG: hypothetical protein JRN16_00645 [Nitrososphaerota archaeon]|jgi:hypothetical protein|nr:hypothetical protein [Nitrososphaerota archaeon]MDG6963785.1 hypothetical protein [Nitrososphaerota archaeon]MDG6974834.1 hypothetical protein [Nitrososphaerota archaeon]MDG7009766.1 hypothetical protein [Nitrososphaerota archaeon]MDG7019230.1 hypothetical protein [Nitrososphaerota archaeon]